jgi:hypothetical protein
MNEYMPKRVYEYAAEIEEDTTEEIIESLARRVDGLRHANKIGDSRDVGLEAQEIAGAGFTLFRPEP